LNGKLKGQERNEKSKNKREETSGKISGCLKNKTVEGGFHIMVNKR
jgi:hypothetical protein